MAKLFEAIKNLTGVREPMDEDAMRRWIRELEAENGILREKLAWRGPWMF